MTTSLSRDRLVHLLAAGRGKRIAVIGDTMLDVYLVGEVDRISPEAPVPVVRVRERRHALGGAANVAQNVAAVGAHCDLVSTVGSDRGAATLREMLAAIGASGDSLVTLERHTTQKTRVVARSQQLLRIDEEDDAELSGAEVERLLPVVTRVVAMADAVILEDYNKGVLAPAVIRAAIDAASARHIPVVVDPKFRNFFSYAGATVFKPNRRELESAIGAAGAMHDDALREVRTRLGVGALLLTLGEEGMALVTPELVTRIPTVAREVYDVVGAGDTVSAYLATTLAAGGTLLEAALLANVAGGIEVGKFGAATVSAEEVLEFCDTHDLHA